MNVFESKHNPRVTVFTGNVSVPFCLRCAFERTLQRVILWMSSGGIQTVFHKDVFDSLYCLLDGNKDFYLVDSVRLSGLSGFLHFDQKHGYLVVNPGFV